MLRLILCCLVLITTFSAYAQPTLCPNTFKYINIGDSEAAVRAACGEPQNVQDKRQAETETFPTEQWIFRIPNEENQAVNRNPSIMFSFRGEKVASIHIEGQNISSTTLCNPTHSIRVGDNKQDVIYFCGTPEITNQGQGVAFKGTSKLKIWTYNFGSFKPGLELTFDKGTLREIREIPIGQ